MEIDKSKINNFKNIINIGNHNSFNGSINISYQKLLVYPDEYLDKNKEYLLICEYGIKSKKISEILNRMGYHVYSLKGGFKNIKE